MPDKSTGALEVLSAALAHHQAGRFEEAERLYQEVLRQHPAHPMGLYLSGALALAMGRPRKARERLVEAVALRPEHVEARFAYASALHRSGASAEAIRTFRALLAHHPEHVGAHVNLSNCLRENGQHEDALAEADAAVALARTSPEARTTRGAALLALGRPDAAIAAYRSAVQIDPRHGAGYAGLAAAHLAAGQSARALADADAALLLLPDLAEGHFLRAMALAGLGAGAAAITALRSAIARDPAHAKAHLNLANLLVDQDRYDEAEALYRRATTLDAKLVEAYTSLACLLTALGRLSEAIAACDVALALDPDCVQAHWNQGIAWLLAGDYEKGWEGYAVRGRRRLAADTKAGPMRRHWQGEDIAGQTILVIAEQGLGDTIQFARYLPLLAARGASAVLACDSALCPLLEKQNGIAAVVPYGSTYPPTDWWVNQMSLPLRFKTKLHSIPYAAGYLHADAGKVARWQSQLPSGGRVGLVWAGNPRHSNDARRSMRLAELRPLLELRGLSFISLQVGPAAGEAKSFSGFLDVSARLTDFAETAALIEALDLVISVDTSSAHCAAALGKETWVMLPHAPDWRWLRDRADSPWYRAIRLFRQPHPGAWAAVVLDVKRSLAERLARTDAGRAGCLSAHELAGP